MAAPSRSTSVPASPGSVTSRHARERFLAALPPASGVADLVVLDVDMRDVYPATHWAIRGEAPAFDTPDEDVYLEGRNVVLLSKTAVFAARTGVGPIVIGPLAGNPFPDARPEFFETMARALSLGLNTSHRRSKRRSSRCTSQT